MVMVRESGSSLSVRVFGYSCSDNKILVVIIIALAAQSAILILQVSLCFLCLKWRARMNDSLPKNVEVSSVQSLHFDFDDIKSATNNFSPDNKLGQGGYGEVYKGILPNGQELAVKRLSNSLSKHVAFVFFTTIYSSDPIYKAEREGFIWSYL